MNILFTPNMEVPVNTDANDQTPDDAANAVRTWDRCDRWCAEEENRRREAIANGETASISSRPASFDNWPESEPHYWALTLYRSACAQDSRFWKNGDITTAAKRLSQLEIALRYGPRALDDGEAYDLANWIETECQPWGGGLYSDNMGKWIEAEDGLFQALQAQGYDGWGQDADVNATIDMVENAGLGWLVWDLDTPHDHFNISSVVSFCAHHGVYLLDDTGWLIEGWRKRAILTLGKALKLLPEGAAERHPWLNEHGGEG